MARDNQENLELSMQEIRECLERSGYLLESKIVRSLTEQGYFVEPSQVIRDATTGKSREIDVVAEYNGYNPNRRHACVKTHFVIEVSNNIYPFVVLTERPSTPNANYESYIKYAYTPAQNPFIGGLAI